jgi:Mg-chelatase subunit ChlD
VKDVVREFVEGRPNDMVGLVVFGDDAFTQCPLTLDHPVLLDLLADIEIGHRRRSHRDRLGLGTAVKRLQKSKAKSKVVVLLTDGRNNAGTLAPPPRPSWPRARAVKVYTIGAGTRGRAPFLVDSMFGSRVVYQDVEIDDDGCARSRRRTGGAYYRAEDREALRAIYGEIDRLERTEITTKSYRRVQGPLSWLVIAALSLLVVEVYAAGDAIEVVAVTPLCAGGLAAGHAAVLSRCAASASSSGPATRDRPAAACGRCGRCRRRGVLPVTLRHAPAPAPLRVARDDRAADRAAPPARRGPRRSVTIAWPRILVALARSSGYTWEEVERRGVDIVVALDVSNSMRVEDAGGRSLSRLERAKRELHDLLQLLSGDRIGIVAFAGTAFVQCPMTLDYGAAELFLDALDTESIPVRAPIWRRRSRPRCRPSGAAPPGRARSSSSPTARITRSGRSRWRSG